MAKMKKVEVVWVDATRETAWCSRGTKMRLETIVSIGYVQDDTKECLVLVGDYTCDQYGRMHAIPKTCIKSIKRLK